MSDDELRTIESLLQTASISDMIPIVVHELRMPLLSMHAATELLHQRQPEREPHMSLSPLIQSLGALRREVDNLLQLRELISVFGQTTRPADGDDSDYQTIAAALNKTFANLVQQTLAVQHIVRSVLDAYSRYAEPQWQQLLMLLSRQLETWSELLAQDLQHTLLERLRHRPTST